MFIEVKIRVNGEEKWSDFRKVFDYMIKEYSKVKYDGKKIDPYPDRVNKFYDSIPKELIDMWAKAYPNVDIKGECEKARVWLLSNTSKAKKILKILRIDGLERLVKMVVLYLLKWNII